MEDLMKQSKYIEK